MPAPITGTSPTRPQRFAVVPPVEVPAARWPWLSRATAPTVPNFRSFSGGATSAIAPGAGAAGAPAGRSGIGRFCARKAVSSPLQRRSVKKKDGATCSSPTEAAKLSAPCPISMTWGDCSMTARAAAIGWRVVVRPATAPAVRSAPFMTAASSSFRPAAVKTAPRPALNSGSSSISWIAAWTASIAVPPLASTPDPAARARVRAAR